jgi:hypothetical protein
MHLLLRRFPALGGLQLFALLCLLGLGMPPATGGKLAFSPAQTQEQLRRTFTFAERAAYQYAIEEVYWRHRIWPRSGGENPGPKPPLDAIVSQRQIEQKVEEYQRKSQLVADQRGSAITLFELQTEMDRMASHTRQPEILRELFAAVRNDPFVIAECLARPILTERLVRECKGGAGPEAISGPDGKTNREAITNSWLSAPATIARGAADPPDAAYKLPDISAPLDCTGDDNWTPTTIVNAPTAREGHSAVWTGSEMIVWGGANFSTPPNTNTGSRYNPATDSWTATSIVNAPDARWRHSTVWTGIEIIVWGGGGNNLILNTGGRYNPITDSWAATSTTNVPVARISHSGVWTGNEMIVWGGDPLLASPQFSSTSAADPSLMVDYHEWE